MLKLLRMFWVILSMFCALFISNPIYAKRAVTTSESLEIQGSKSHFDPVEYKYPGIPHTSLSITMNGVHAEGYTQGLIIASMEQLDERSLLALSNTDRYILAHVGIHVEARCISMDSSAKRDINELVDLDPSQGTVLSCKKGEGLEIYIFEPDLPHTAVFTLTKTTEIEEAKPAIRLTTAVASPLAQPVGEKLVGKRSMSPYPAVIVNSGNGGCGIQ